MSGLNLRWWRKRPSVHVADPPPKASYFSLLSDKLVYDLSGFDFAKLNGLRDITIAGDKRGHFRPGTHVEYEGRFYKVQAVEKRDPDDWFGDGLRVTLQDPVAAANPPVYHWLEDELMPRMTARS